MAWGLQPRWAGLQAFWNVGFLMDLGSWQLASELTSMPVNPYRRDEPKVSLYIDNLPGRSKPPAPKREVAGDAGWRTGAWIQNRRIGDPRTSPAV